MRFLAAVAAAALACVIGAAHAQSFPAHTVTLVSPFPPGGSTDAIARIMAQRMGTSLVPSVDEAGVPGLYLPGWFGFFAPKGTPKEAIAKLNAAMMDALADPAIRARFADLGLDIVPRERQSPEALAAFQKAEIDKWLPLIKQAGIKIE